MRTARYTSCVNRAARLGNLGFLRGIGLLGALLLGMGQARPVAIGGAVQPASIATRVLTGGEMLPVWSLPRLGVEVRNDPRDLRLRVGGRELRYAPGLGWRAIGLRLDTPLPAPQVVGASLHVPLSALRLLGVAVQTDTADLLGFVAPVRVADQTLPPSPDLPAPMSPAPISPAPVIPAAPAIPATFATQVTPGDGRVPAPLPVTSVPAAGQFLTTVRVHREEHRSVSVQRVVLELSGGALPRFEVQTRTSGGLTVRLPGVGASPSSQDLPSGQALTVGTDAGGSWVTLGTAGGRSEVFALSDPPRVVIDTVTHEQPQVPPPLNPAALPPGVGYQQRGALHLLSFDPARFQAQVVSAARGQFADVAELVEGVGGVAGVNASYFDPASALPVDLVVRAGLMTAPSLEKRGTVGLMPGGGLIFGYPRPRYRVSGDFGEVAVNSVSAKARPEWLTAFVGDGQTAVGGGGLVTVYTRLGESRVLDRQSAANVPPPGILALTFDPRRFAVPQEVGANLRVTLDWRSDDAPWPQVRDALSAGPLLVQAGRVVVDGVREGFDTGASIWRPTRQVALGLLRGQPTIAYFEYGTPEAFASALRQAGLSDAVRLDSGSSATAFSTSGYGQLGGYLNTVWSRPVPNAIVFVPREQAGR